MSLFKKNASVTGFPFTLIATADGSAITTGTPVGYIVLDGGTQAAIADTSPVHEGNGQWTFDLTAGEMNGDIIGFLIIHTSAINAHFTIKTDSKIISELNDAVTAPTAVQNRTEMDSNSVDLNTIITNVATAQTDLDTITGSDGATLATTQGLYAPAKAGDNMGLAATATSAQLIDDMWDEALSAHNTGGTSGKALRNAADYVISDDTAQAGTATTITLGASESSIDDFFEHESVIITEGTGVGQVRVINHYNGTSKVADIIPAWKTNPDNTSKYQIMPALTHSVSDSTTVTQGFAAAGGASTITLDSNASTTNDFYTHETIQIHSGTGEGQCRVVSGYVGSTKIATVDIAWDTTPDTTSEYVLSCGLGFTHMADILLDEALSGHTTVGSLGKAIADTETDATAIKAKTDQMTYTKANELDANTKSINGATVVGDGNATPWDGA